MKTALSTETTRPTCFPKTKFIPVWHVEHSHCRDGSWQPGVALRDNYAFAVACLETLRRQPNKYACIAITGPHQHRVPA